MQTIRVVSYNGKIGFYKVVVDEDGDVLSIASEPHTIVVDEISKLRSYCESLNEALSLPIIVNNKRHTSVNWSVVSIGEDGVEDDE